MPIGFSPKKSIYVSANLLSPTYYGYVLKSVDRIPFWHPPLSGSLMNWGGKVQTKVVLRRPSTRQKQKVCCMVRRLYIKDWVKCQLFCDLHGNSIFGSRFLIKCLSLFFSKAEEFS